METLEMVKPGITAKLVDWLKMYKVCTSVSVPVFMCRNQAFTETGGGGLTTLLFALSWGGQTSDGKAENSLASETPTSVAEAHAIIEECHERWQALKSGTAGTYDFFLGM